jgi:hypothetical protein
MRRWGENAAAEELLLGVDDVGLARLPAAAAPRPLLLPLLRAVVVVAEEGTVGRRRHGRGRLAMGGAATPAARAAEAAIRAGAKEEGG